MEVSSVICMVMWVQ